MSQQPALSERAPRRRSWFSFSLRTMFVLMTLLACLLGWQLNAVRVRKAIRQELMAKSVSFTTSQEMLQRYPAGFNPPRVPTIPAWRQWLGDEAIAEIWVSPYRSEDNEATRQLAAETFPEAEIREALFEPCHPGCFPAGTVVLTPQGGRGIETIRVGDLLSTVAEDGEMVPFAVQSIFVTTNRLWRIVTDDGELITTETQPLCASLDQLVTAETLTAGDRLLCWRDGEIRSVMVESVERAERIEEVYNLVLSNSEVFVAGGFLARSKPPAEASTTIASGKLRQVLPDK